MPSSPLTDFTLASGQSATFTWASEGGISGRTRFDNIAIIGTVTPIPDPSAAQLGCVGLLALLRRRR